MSLLPFSLLSDRKLNTVNLRILPYASVKFFILINHYNPHKVNSYFTHLKMRKMWFREIK